MARLRRGPDELFLRRAVEEQWTQQRIADEWEIRTGQRVSRSAIGMALERAGLPSPRPRKKYADLIPWRVRRQHDQHRDLHNLRLEARRQAGGELTQRQTVSVDNWLEALNRANASVIYLEDSDDGFYWVKRQDGWGIVAPVEAPAQ